MQVRWTDGGGASYRLERLGLLFARLGLEDRRQVEVELAAVEEERHTRHHERPELEQADRLAESDAELGRRDTWRCSGLGRQRGIGIVVVAAVERSKRRLDSDELNAERYLLTSDMLRLPQSAQSVPNGHFMFEAKPVGDPSSQTTSPVRSMPSAVHVSRQA